VVPFRGGSYRGCSPSALLQGPPGGPYLRPRTGRAEQPLTLRGLGGQATDEMSPPHARRISRCWTRTMIASQQGTRLGKERAAPIGEYCRHTELPTGHVGRQPHICLDGGSSAIWGTARSGPRSEEHGREERLGGSSDESCDNAEAYGWNRTPAVVPPIATNRSGKSRPREQSRCGDDLFAGASPPRRWAAMSFHRPRRTTLGQ
jgi:hypothetical protein